MEGGAALPQGPQRNHLAEDALLLAAASALHSSAARAALLGEPGTVAHVAATLRRCCQHLSQEQQAAFCATLIGALAWWVGPRLRLRCPTDL